MRIGLLASVAAVAAMSTVVGAPDALAASPPPPPTATGGEPVTTVASGLETPTSFAFGPGVIFEGDGGSETSSGPPNGGVFLLGDGAATRVAATPQFVAGLAWHGGALYVSGGTVAGKQVKWQLQRWSGWNGSKFTTRSVIWTAPPGLDGLNGIAFGPDGRLYVGVDVGLTDNNDHGPAATPYVYDLLSFSATGGNMRVFATGMRQPWQIAFAHGSADPFVSDLGPDKGVTNPPDFLLRVHPGDNYGFPQCNGTVASLCEGFATPAKSFKPHTDIMGLAIIGSRLYMSSFSGIGGKGKGGEVLSMPLTGGTPTPVLTGFVAPIVGLAAHGPTLYVGEVTGQVFSVKP